MIKTLELLKFLVDQSDEGASVTELKDQFDCSDRLLRRHIIEARMLGAQLVQVTHVGQQNRWVCTNRQEILKGGILDKWLSVERGRTVVPPAVSAASARLATGSYRPHQPSSALQVIAARPRAERSQLS